MKRYIRGTTRRNPFQNQIDRDLLDSIDLPVPDNPITDNGVKCSRSAVRNALFYVFRGEDVVLHVGNMFGQLSPLITHCWIEHNGQVLETHVPNQGHRGLASSFSVNLIPGDVDGSRDLIREFVRRVRNSV